MGFKDLAKKAKEPIYEISYNGMSPALPEANPAEVRPSVDTMAEEGFRPRPYRDSLGILTVGRGFNIEEPHVRRLIHPQVLQGVRDMSLAEADSVFETLNKQGRAAAEKYLTPQEWSSQPQPVKDVLTDMAYNMGEARLAKFQKLNAALKAKDYEKAANEILNSRYAKQVPNRAKRNAEIVRKLKAADRARTPAVPSVAPITRTPPSGNILTDIAKGLGRGTETAAGSMLGGGAEVLGRAMQSRDIDVGGLVSPLLSGRWKVKAPEWVNKPYEIIGKGLSAGGKFFKNKLHAMARTGWEAADPSLTWKEHPYRWFAANVSEATPAMLGAMATTAITKNPLTGASLFFPIIASNHFDEQIEKGVPEDIALKGAIVSGITQTLLECYSLGVWQKGRTAIARIVKGLVNEGIIEEGGQQLTDNLIGILESRYSKEGFKSEDFLRDLTRGLAESIVIGGGLGALMGIPPESFVTAEKKLSEVADQALEVAQRMVQDETGGIKKLSTPKEGGQPRAGGLPANLTPQEKATLDKMNITDRKIIRLQRDVTVKDVYGNSKTYKKGHEITIYKDTSTGKALAKDGTKGIVPNKATQQIEQAGYKLGEEFSPELKGVEEVVKSDAEIKKPSAGVPYGLENPEIYTGESRKTKFSQYQLPGGENYREVLIKASNLSGKVSHKYEAKPYKGKWAIFEEGVEFPLSSGYTTKDSANYYIETQYSKETDRIPSFKSSHWDEPNVLAHLRMNDRTTPDGKKVLFIEELQSDWAREARKGADVKTFEEYLERLNVDHADTTAEQLKQYRQDFDSGKQVGKYSSHPLLKNWQELALKRAIKEAVDGGYDYISWTTGEQQAERYDLSKQIKELKWWRRTDGTYDVSAYKDGLDPVIEKESLSKQELEATVGKEVAKKIIESPEDTKLLKTPDLKIGGEWAKNLYDRQVPNILKDLTRGEVETIEIDTPSSTKLNISNRREPIRDFVIPQTLTQPALKITPEVKARISAQPMAGGMVPGPKEKLWTEEGFAINPEKIEVSPEAKQKILEVSKDIKGELEDIKGSTLKHEEVIEAAKEAKLLNSVVTKEQTKQLIAAIYATRQQLAALAEGKTVTKDLIDILSVVSSEASNAGRLLESFDISAYPEYAQTKVELLRKLIKLGVNADTIVKAAEGVDFEDMAQVTKFYRQFVKPKLSELIAEYRYINLLSSPLTHIINAFSNALQVLGLSGITKLTSGLIDPIASRLFGTERSHYLSQVPAYYKGLFASSGDAVSKAYDVLRGKSRIKRPDMNRIPTGSKLLEPLQFVTRALEAGDIFFSTLAAGGELEAITSKLTDITPAKLAKAKALADKKAQYFIYRQELDPSNKTGQGTILASIDKITSGVYSLRGNGLVAWYIPFVQTPMAIAKQGIEYSPLGFSTLVGSKDKVEQTSKAFIGSMVFAGAGLLALKGLLTWAAPRDKKEKELFYASGRKPYSVKIGDKWISFSKLGPISYPIAMAAALQWHLKENPKSLTDTTMQRWLKGFGAIAEFFSDQSYMQSLGDMVKAFQGDSSALSSSITNVPTQLVPLSSLLRWTSNIIDPVFRDTDKDLSLDSLVASVQKGIPFASKMLPAKLDSKGQPIEKSYNVINAFSPMQFSKVELSEEEKLQNLRRKQEIRSLKTYKSKVLDEISNLKKQGRFEEAERLRSQEKARIQKIKTTIKERPRQNGFLALLNT